MSTKVKKIERNQQSSAHKIAKAEVVAAVPLEADKSSIAQIPIVPAVESVPIVTFPSADQPTPSAAPVNEPATAEVGPLQTSALGLTMDESEKSRQRISDLLGISISPARVRRHLDRMGVNKSIDDLIDSLHAEAIANPAVEADAKSKIMALASLRIRFSHTAPIVLAIVLDYLVHQLIGHAIERAIAAKKYIVHIFHMHLGLDKVPLSLLIRGLPQFIEAEERFNSEMRASEINKIMNVTKAAAIKEFRSKHTVSKKGGASRSSADTTAEQASTTADAEVATVNTQITDTITDEPQQSDDSAANADFKIGFKFYVGQICKMTVAGNEDFAGVRMSSELKLHISDLIIGLIQRIVTHLSINISDLQIKTVNNDIIMRVINSILADCHPFKEEVSFTPCKVTDNEALKAEKQKKAAAKTATEQYTIDIDKLPKIDGYLAAKKVEYIGTFVGDLAKHIEEKMKNYNDSGAEVVEAN